MKYFLPPHPFELENMQNRCHFDLGYDWGSLMEKGKAVPF